MKSFQQFQEDTSTFAQQYRAYLNSPEEKLAARRREAMQRTSSSADDFTRRALENKRRAQERHDELSQSYQKRVEDARQKREQEQQRKEQQRQEAERKRKEAEQQAEELQLEQIPPPLERQKPFNVFKAREQAKSGPSHRKHVHSELSRKEGAEEAAHLARLKSIMTREE